jgi:hypothetical protein
MRVTTTVTASIEQAKRYINIALHDIHLGFDYKLPWCEQSAYIRTKAPYTTGTISATVGSDVLTGSSTVWTTTNAYGEANARLNGKLLLAGGTEVYRAGTIAASTITMYQKYIGSENLSGDEYIYFEDEYTLASDFLRPIDFQIFSPAMGIQLISRAEFRRRFPVVRVSGRPRVACLIESTSTVGTVIPIRRILMYPYPDQAYMIPYNYISSTIATSSAGAPQTSLSADNDVPVMPLRYRHAISYHAMYHWYRDKRDDARSEQAKAEYTEIMARIVGDHDIATHTKVQIQPNVRGYHSSAYAPYSHRSGKMVYDLHDDFDSFKR